MVLDIPTLSFAVTVMVALASLVLFGHWLARQGIDGLFLVSGGFVLSAFGTESTYESIYLNGLTVFPSSMFLVIAGYAFLWRGMLDLWQSKSKPLLLSSRIIPILFIALSLVFSVSGFQDISTTIPIFLFMGVLSLGIAAPLYMALNSRYDSGKNIMNAGGAPVLVLLVTHAIACILMAFPGLLSRLFQIDAISYQSIIHVEYLMFTVGFVLVVIIMTAERVQAEMLAEDMKDPNTQALKRRVFAEVMKAVLARARRSSDPVSFILFYVNDFKALERQYKNAVLVSAIDGFAAFVMKGRRDQDIFCRLSDEEFVLMLPGTPEEGSELVASRIRDQLENPVAHSVDLIVNYTSITMRGEDLDAQGVMEVMDTQVRLGEKLAFDSVKVGMPATA